MLVNFTNHPSASWPEEQRRAAEKYGPIVDRPFPMVNAEWPESEIRRIALRESEAICALQPSAVVCQGEFTLAYAVIRQLIGKGVPVLAACSNRVAEETMSPDGEILRKSVFRFVRFRSYNES